MTLNDDRKLAFEIPDISFSDIRDHLTAGEQWEFYWYSAKNYLAPRHIDRLIELANLVERRRRQEQDDDA